MNAQASFDDYRRELGDRARDHGAAGALGTATDWSEEAQLVLDELIERGQAFTSEDVRLIVGPSPSDGGLGALFLTAAKARRIACIGVERSKRPARHGGLLRVWKAVDAP